MTSYETKYNQLYGYFPTHIWRVIEYTSWNTLLTQLNSNFSKNINITKFNWLTWGGLHTSLGKINAGSSGILLGLRALLLKFLNALVSDPYERIILTRSDYYHACSHPNIHPNIGQIFIPSGETWGGVSDRYTIFNWRDKWRVLNTLDWLIENKITKSGDLESTLLAYYKSMKLKVTNFDRTMFTIGVKGDRTRWMPYKKVSCLKHIMLKYAGEFNQTRKTCTNITEFNITQNSLCRVRKKNQTKYIK